jgi:predicted ATP-grasp superfamily ATP-dependent carboligase
LGYPVIVKPVESVTREGSGPLRRTEVTIAQRAADLADAWQHAAGGAPALVQSVVPGWGEGLFVLRWGGRTLARFAHRRLREKPPEGGVSTLRESIAVDRDELARFEGLLDELRFDGVAMAEYRTDGRTRWLMEFNARFWGSLQLAIDAGVDFPRLLVEAAAGMQCAEPPPYRVGVRSRWLLGDLDHALLLARGGRNASGDSGLCAALRVLLAPNGSACHLEVLRLDDPLPFLLELRAWVASLARSGQPAT